MRRILAILLLAPLLLVGCQSSGISRQPTPYTVMSAMGGSSFTVRGYLKADHPDVKACLALVEQFLQVYLNQDYQQLTLEERARPFMETTSIGDDTLTGHIRRYMDDEVTVVLQSLDPGGIAFTAGSQGRLVDAALQVEGVVRYTHGSSGWLHSIRAELDQDYRGVWQMLLMKEDDGWKVWSVYQSQAGA